MGLDVYVEWWQQSDGDSSGGGGKNAMSGLAGFSRASTTKEALVAFTAAPMYRQLTR